MGLFFNSPHILALEVSFLAAFISALGLLSMAAFGDLGSRMSPYISAFAVGVLVTSTLFHLIPEGYSLSPNFWSWLTLSFLFFLVMGVVFRILTSGASINTDLAFASSSIIALGAHSFLDGILYAIAFQGSPATGWLTAMGLLVHEFPEGIIIFFLLRDANLSTVPATIIAFLAACLTTIVGTLVALSFINIAQAALPIMMGVTAGAFIYLIISHLGPHAATAPDRRGYLAASIGVVVGTIAIIIEHI